MDVAVYNMHGLQEERQYSTIFKEGKEKHQKKEVRNCIQMKIQLPDPCRMKLLIT